MIKEKTIARIFAICLLIGLISVCYVLLTQPTGMITYQENPSLEEKKTMSEEEMLNVFENEWEKIKNQLIILEETK
ncbi:hypothetical protein KY304_00175 [Candidatus Woesearchaeota archaeon]|nr:hypothetical protein [Candidatus Woesearchaeota archaeon]MBW2978512.1 hypothetical protein [Candidatus Woesearchaeota archaeon]